MSRLEEKPNTLVLYGGLGLLTLFTMGALLYFFYIAAITAHNMVTLPAHISFDKGAFYLLGAGTGLSALIFAGVYESCLRKELSKKRSSVIAKVAFVGLLIMLVLPHLAHYFIGDFLKDQGYLICREASRQWLHSKTIVYVKNSDMCLQLVEKKK